MKREESKRKSLTHPSFPILPSAILLLAAVATGATAQEIPLLTLEEALKSAFEANPTYRIAKVEVQAAENTDNWGRAGILPRLEANALYNRRFYGSQGSEGSDGDGTEAGSAALRADWTVFRGLTSIATKNRLETQARVASLRAEAARHDLGAAVILAYGNAVRHARLLLALDSVLAFSRERVRLTQGKYSLGSASKLELLQARIDQNTDSSARLRQELALALSKRELNLLMGRPEEAAFRTRDSLALSPLPPLESLRSRALESSPAILQATENRRLASIAYSEYVGRLFPEVGVNAAYSINFNTNQEGFLLPGDQRGWNYGATLRWSLFDGGALATDLRNARLASTRAELQYEDARRRIESGLAGAWDAYRASLQALALEVDNLELARENAVIARERLRLGTIASLELREAQEKFLEAENRAANARFEAKRSETELLRLAARL